MRKSIIVSLFVVTVFSLSGCDWIRGQLGMPTSADLESVRKMQSVSVEDTIVASVTDSIDSLASADTLKNDSPGKQQVLQQTARQKRYFIITGSFKDPSNAQKMAETLKKNGYTPVDLKLKNGFVMVAAGSYDTEADAGKEMKRMLEKDFSPGDLWVYDANTNKHITN
jgi:hypothetical protein